MICNGGHLYWHEGKTPDMTRRVAAAFDRIGLPAVAEALRSSLRAFPGGAPPEDATERHRTIAGHRDELEAKFHGLDQVIWDADYEGAALAYVEANRAALVAIAPEYAALLRLN